jgi:hypothetical protein
MKIIIRVSGHSTLGYRRQIKTKNNFAGLAPPSRYFFASPKKAQRRPAARRSAPAMPPRARPELAAR